MIATWHKDSSSMRTGLKVASGEAGDQLGQVIGRGNLAWDGEWMEWEDAWEAKSTGLGDGKDVWWSERGILRMCPRFLGSWSVQSSVNPVG